MSSGGYGHIPLPLIRGELSYHEPPEKFDLDFCFFGANHQGTRERVLDTLKRSMIASNLTYKFGSGENSDH